MTDQFNDERGVSEVLGYILLFSIVILSIGAVSTFGINALQDGRDVAIVDNMERGFVGMATSGQDILQENGNSRSFQFNPDRGQISSEGPVQITVSVDGTTVSDVTTQPIVYWLDDARISYVAGGVLRSEDGGAAVVHRPSFRLDSDSTIIPLMNLTSRTPDRSVGGRTDVELKRVGDETYLRHGTDMEVNITITTVSNERAKAWAKVLFEDNCEVDANTVSCEYDSDRVLVHQVNVSYRFDT